MPSAQDAVLPAGRRLLRSIVVASAVVSAVLPAAVASADEPSRTTVVGELLQAWPETERPDAEAEGPLSWIRTAAGDAVRVPTEDVAGFPAGATVQVTVGSQVQDTAATEDGYDPAREVLTAKVVEAAPTAPVLRSPAGFTNQVTVVMVQPAGVAKDSVTRAQVVDAVDGPVADFWSEQSNGVIEVGVSASYDWTTTVAGCSDPTALWAEVTRQVGFVPGPGKHLLLYLSSAATDCSYALAQVGSAPSSGGMLYVRDTIPSVIAHELGHNFGLGHSSGRQCDGAVETGSCRTAGYRDYYDVMGVSWAQTGSLNAAQAARLGVLPPAQQESLTVEGSAATVTLAPLSGGTGTRALRLTDADGGDYWLEYRTATLRDAWLGTAANRYKLQSGVLLHRAEGLPDTSVLLDGTPAPVAGWDADLQAALPIGAPVPVSGGDFTVVVQSVSPAGAVLSVTPSPPAAAAAPAPAVETVGAVPGGLMTGTVGRRDSGSVDPTPEAAAPAAPRFRAPGYGRTQALHGTTSLESAADTRTGGGFIVAVAATVLAGALLLVMRRLRGSPMRGAARAGSR